MTDTSYAVTTIAGHDYAHTLPSHPHAAPVLDRHHHHQHHHPAAPIYDGSQEDDGQISCICGYLDDDGWTVQCDYCKRWQHQLCYYPEYEDRALPEDLQHYCVECQPRPYDHENARARQRLKREEHSSEINGIKRPPPKNSKKKAKDSPYTNGWPLDKSRHDRNSASPRDQPPPAKRPKTSHRPSDSITKGHSRKRNTSNANHSRSVSRSPESPSELYSEHFMRCYHDDCWDPIDVNLHNSIGISNALTEWLNISDDTFREMHGHEKTDALNRWDGSLDDIPGKAHIEIRTTQDDRVQDGAGNYPFWRWVTVKDSVASGAYIGELTGHVGFQDEYIRDPSNRWSLLRHPEPFVFFHPALPICIDARNEGTELRYVRRSCRPNAKIQILVTDSTVYRFCFMAKQQIDPGTEVAVAWDTRDLGPEIQAKIESGMGLEKEMDNICAWVSNALANCGPCACQPTPEAPCMMAHLDRRGQPPKIESELQYKAPKAKRKKVGHQISPVNTHINSRSGSEARRVDLDDEPSDSRSPSGSAGGDSASRDMTPNSHYAQNGGLSAIPELSERERKKLAKEEEMFRRQEVAQTGKQGKKKRNSGGSNLNTPNATTSKQLGYPGPSKYTDAGTPKQAGLPAAKSGRRPKGSTAQKSPATPAARWRKGPRLEYVDSDAQCDLEKEESERLLQSSLSRKPFLSTTHRLLQRCAINNARRKGPTAVAEAERLIKDGDQMDVDRSPTEKMISEAPLPRAEHIHQSVRLAIGQDPSGDAEMKDADTSDEAKTTTAHIGLGTQEGYEGKSITPSMPGISFPYPTEPSAPPWPSQAAHLAPETTTAPPIHPHKPPDMHLQMPPPPANPFAPALSTDTPNSVTSLGSVTQSPMSFSGSGAIFSPAVHAAVTPSPAKKKMSLSDYTKRNKAKDNKEVEAKGDRESSPALSASGRVVPPVQEASSSSEDVVQVGDDTTTAAAVEEEEEEEDVKMEDAAGDDAGAATTTTLQT